MDRTKWIWCANNCGVANTEMGEIYHKFGSIDDIYIADYDKYIAEGISEKLAERLSDKSLDQATQISRDCSEMGVEILAYSDDRYPRSLRSLKDAPAVLYCLGELPDINRLLCISIVGTRSMSEYGMRTAYKIAYETASAGAIIASGMALGIDSVAHSATIAAGGRTIAVLGCGIDVIYPKEHARLRDEIINKGAIITEFPPKSKPFGFHFPLRNRIISGLSQGTVVIDASLDSGSMITAKNAILQGRDLFAVPSNIDSKNSEGTNLLIKDGAQAILSGSDIIRHYFYVYRNVVDLGGLKEGSSRSDFNASALTSLGVKVLGEAKPSRAAFVKNEKPRKINSLKGVEASPNASAQTGAVSVKDESHEATNVRGGDESNAALMSLSEKHRKVFDEMPLDKAISTDYLVKAGFKLAEVIGALTVLEIKGLISSLPGALYIRK